VASWTAVVVMVLMTIIITLVANYVQLVIVTRDEMKSDKAAATSKEKLFDKQLPNVQLVE